MVQKIIPIVTTIPFGEQGHARLFGFWNSSVMNSSVTLSVMWSIIVKPIFLKTISNNVSLPSFYHFHFPRTKLHLHFILELKEDIQEIFSLRWTRKMSHALSKWTKEWWITYIMTTAVLLQEGNWLKDTNHLSVRSCNLNKFVFICT